ncbi:NADH-quinone oxidoreductase subunit C [Nitratiruptor tergarcus]|uniref:NADH-quinone oxidoreductase subunit C n=1 Tax=Nitratiruptor tergarcus DSM 16512 TaxID=1069081 RepID=A0A1W1WRQ4_9BACT|nr:NADH-quinone oxidoreductase subunit C [Nitratiruptor tergarcus]SMC08984.1 NADH dehydrogenase subunit C [Nitratiruptor tergarcus DSM 16512]
MRPYRPKDNVQKKSYYTDRFWVAPKIPHEPVEDEVFKADLASLKKSVKVKDAYIERGQMVIIVDAKDNVATLKHLKEECGYDVLSEMSAIDYLAKDGEFEIFYQLLAMSKRKRVRVKCRIKEDQAIESVEPLFRSADWSEREMYDMFGIKVNNHPYLKRILMPEDWVGHPLRKAYPLHGDEAAQWYEVDKIFGKEYRDVIGPEQRDPAYISTTDTCNFARIYHEVPRCADPNSEPEQIESFNEDAPLVETFDLKKAKIVDKTR